MQKDEITQKILDRNLTIIRKNLCELEYIHFIENAEYISFESFCILYRNYYILLEKFLKKKLPLNDYERRIQNHKFGILPSNRSGFFQGMISTWGCQYCKLLVFPKLQVLRENDVNMMLSLNAQMLDNPDSSLLAYIDRTYRSVLDLEHREGITHIVDHMNHKLIRKLNIEIAYDESNLNKFGMNDEWYEAWREQSCFLGETGEKMQQEFSEILGIDVQITFWSL